VPKDLNLDADNFLMLVQNKHHTNAMIETINLDIVKGPARFLDQKINKEDAEIPHQGIELVLKSVFERGKHDPMTYIV
jgi:hypothetical protein